MSVSRQAYFEKVARKRRAEQRIVRPRKKPPPDLPQIPGLPPRSTIAQFSQRLLWLNERTRTRIIREAAVRRLRIWILYTKITGAKDTKAWRIEPYSYRIRRMKAGGRYKVGIPKTFLFGYDQFGE